MNGAIGIRPRADGQGSEVWFTLPAELETAE
jgi:hypothetical protein